MNSVWQYASFSRLHGFDRLKKTSFADGSLLQNTTLDDDGNVKKLKNRAGENIVSTFDKNDRIQTKSVPASAANTVTRSYDLTGAIVDRDHQYPYNSAAYTLLGGP